MAMEVSGAEASSDPSSSEEVNRVIPLQEEVGLGPCAAAESPAVGTGHPLFLEEVDDGLCEEGDFREDHNPIGEDSAPSCSLREDNPSPPTPKPTSSQWSFWSQGFHHEAVGNPAKKNAQVPLQDLKW
ncbi:hypothetical protein O3P69_018159 [Scylla paramamosain]|uniref:Uncharacterized protein n=1 Tax=Scylla paramamosain TaxID=85552 RepID=A0AAW0TJU0_SCYPA